VKKKYETDLSDEEWEILEKRFREKLGNYGKNGNKKRRKLVNAVLYRTKTGCQWRMLPKDFGKWETVWSFFRRCKLSGMWELILADMVRISRIAAGREPEPTYSLIDSQSVKTTAECEEVGFDGGKKS
jgi:putative transposase